LPLVAIAAAIAWWQSEHADRATEIGEARSEAIDAMKAYREAEHGFAAQYTELVSHLSSTALFGDARAIDGAIAKLISATDTYLTIIDRAVERSDAYVAIERPDDATARSLGVIRKRATSWHRVRDRLATLQHRIASGSADASSEVSSTLTSIGFEMVVDDAAARGAP
jgi:hypothetical protein